MKKKLEPLLECIKEPDKNCNNGLYRVTLPNEFLPIKKFDGNCVGAYQVYFFVGLK
ncbi:hypothetical protein CCP1ISM_50036 [Azospirillaceae bacterium]